MSILQKIQKPDDRLPVVTILGEAGLAKTSLAATFPKPIFIRAEDGLQSIPHEQRPDAFPVIKGEADVWEQLTALVKEDHDYKTVVIDSVTALERLFITSVVASDPKQPETIKDALGGYGAGFEAVSAMHRRVRKFCEVLNVRKGMAVVFIAHSDFETVTLPDADKFNRYSLRLDKKSIPHYVDDVDVVGQLKLQQFVKAAKKEHKQAISDGTLLLACHAQAACISKNRYGITEDLIFEKNINPLKQFIKGI